jgi:predicted nuclease of predicted toxin-antitoxin system
MMRLLADENFPRVAVTAFEAAGHDILWVRTGMPGASDVAVLREAGRQGRVLLTFDKDFGELAARSGLPPGCGVVLFRVPAPRSDSAARRLVIRVAARDDWVGHFSVVEPGRVRMRRPT